MFSSVLLFFEFTAPEIMLILFVVLLLFGGEKLPGLAKGLGRGIREFKDASEGIKREITNQIDTFETKKTEQAAANTVETPVNDAPKPANEVPGAIEHHDNSVPVAEIGSIAAVEPVKVEEPTPVEPAHLKETPIERVVPEPANTAHEEHKS